MVMTFVFHPLSQYNSITKPRARFLLSVIEDLTIDFPSVRDFIIHFNTNGLGLRSNAIKDLCPLILYQLVVGWIGKAHGPTNSNDCSWVDIEVRTAEIS